MMIVVDSDEVPNCILESECGFLLEQSASDYESDLKFAAGRNETSQNQGISSQ
jgi:hypothetical protein